MSGTWTTDFQGLAESIDSYIKKGGSVKKLAFVSDVSRLTLQRWAKGKPPATIAMACRIAKALDVLGHGS